LGEAKLRAGDWEGGLELLRQAEANFGIAEKQTDFHESAMVDAYERAKTNGYIGATLFQHGKKAEGIAAVDAAVHHADDGFKREIFAGTATGLLRFCHSHRIYSAVR